MIGLFSVFAVSAAAVAFFVPLFVIALIVTKSLQRSLALAAVFSVGAAVGFALGAAMATWVDDLARAREFSPDMRSLMGLAIATVCAIAGGVLALKAFAKNGGMPRHSA
jgi:hypothetical protein